MKPEFSMDTLNDNFDNAKSCQWKRFTLQFAAKNNFPLEYFLAAETRDIYIIKGDKNLIAFISLLLIQKKCIQKIIFLKEVCLRVDFSTSAEPRISEQTMQTKIMQICGSPCYKQLRVLRFKRTKMFVSFKATFHLKDFRESENNTMWSIYFNQETLTVSVSRIYHIETHVTNK